MVILKEPVPASRSFKADICLLKGEPATMILGKYQTTAHILQLKTGMIPGRLSESNGMIVFSQSDFLPSPSKAGMRRGALGAARTGVKTMLIESCGVLGGVATWSVGMPINQMRPMSKPRSVVHELLIETLAQTLQLVGAGELAVSTPGGLQVLHDPLRDRLADEREDPREGGVDAVEEALLPVGARCRQPFVAVSAHVVGTQ